MVTEETGLLQRGVRKRQPLAKDTRPLVERTKQALEVALDELQALEDGSGWYGLQKMRVVSPRVKLIVVGLKELLEEYK